MKKKIVDLGCGTGNDLLPYADRYDLVGYDLDKTNIALCKEQMPKGSFYVSDITTIGLSHLNNVERIQCTEVIEHIPQWKAALRALSTVHEGANLYLTVPHRESEDKLKKIRPHYWDEIGHHNLFDGSEIAEVLTQFGWKDIRIKRKNAALYFELKRLFQKNAPCIRNTYYKNVLSLPERSFYQLFRPNLFQTHLKYIPLWLLTLPLAKIIDPIFGATIEITATKS